MADTVETPEVVNVEETVKEKEVAVDEVVPVSTEKVADEPEENSTGETNGKGNSDEPKENGTPKEENGTKNTESADERKRKSIDVGDAAEISEVSPDKKAKLEEKTEGKQDEVVEAEQIAA